MERYSRLNSAIRVFFGGGEGGICPPPPPYVKQTFFIYSHMCFPLVYAVCHPLSLFLKYTLCPHFRGWYVQASMELGPKDVSLLERYVSSFQRVVCTGFNGVGI